MTETERVQSQAEGVEKALCAVTDGLECALEQRLGYECRCELD